MDVRKGLMLTLTLALTAAGGACASAGGGAAGTGGGAGLVLPGGQSLAQGVSPKKNEFTDKAEDELDQAQKAETPDAAEPHYEAALAAAKQAIAADSTNPLGHLLAARAALGAEDYMTAGHEFDRAEELRPIYQLQTEGMREQAWIALYRKAAPLVNSGDYEGAAKIFEQANAIYQQRPEVMITLGQIYASLGEADKAVENLNRADSLINSDKLAQMDSATAADWQKQDEQIPQIITQALLQAQKYDQAEEHLRKLLAKDPTNLEYLQLLGNVYATNNEADSAKATYHKVLAHGDLTPQQYYQIGVGFYQLDDWTDASGAFQKAADMSPKDRDAIEMWARSLQLANEDADSTQAAPVPLDQILSATQRWAALDPYSRNALLIEAQTANKMKNSDLANQLVDKIQSLPISVQDLALRRRPDGGATLNGSVMNVSSDAGKTVTLNVTFYDNSGQALGTKSVQVSLPAKDAREDFNVDFDSDQTVGGYDYTVTM